MQTKYAYRWLFFATVFVVLLTAILALTVNWEIVQRFGRGVLAMEISHAERLGTGDCFADGASGDFYLRHGCSYSTGNIGGYSMATEQEIPSTSISKVVPPIATPIPPKNDKPENPTLVPPTNTPGVPPVENTPVPPTVNPPADPTEVPPTIAPTEPPVTTPEPKACKNPNQFKDGTPDCNAGQGND